MKIRIEKDSLGKRPIPAQVYWGVETSRAVENFPISGLRFHPQFIRALAWVKKACAETNLELGKLDARRGRAILRACDEILAGKWYDQFVTDALQSGAGVSAHMNMNEVIANRALEILGRKKGDYAYLHSHDHVNMGQSTNDVVPTAMRLATLQLVKEFCAASKILEKAFASKAREFRRVVKSGRTHLQDAAPVTLGQEFGGWARQLEKGRGRVERAAINLHEIGIGGSAVGTGLNTTLAYRRRVIQRLRRLSGFPVYAAKDYFEVMQSDSDLAAASGALRQYSISLSQICNDLRLLSSGPNTGFGEIHLPPRQPGSSIMPGKINPVMPEAAVQAAFHVIGNDLTIVLAAAAGQQELNVMRPVIAYNLLQSFEILKNTAIVLSKYCISGIKADVERCRWYAEKSVGIAAALNPYIGYSRAAECVKEATRTGKSLREIVLAKKYLKPAELDRILSPENLTRPKNK